MITIFRRFQHAGFSSEVSYFWDKMKIRFCNLRLLKIPVRQMYLQDMHFCPHCTVKKIRDLGYASWILQCYTSKSKSDFFPEASVNRIKTYCNWFLLRPSQSYLRENKKIANNWRHYVILTQTGSQKSGILLIHFCSNIHSFMVLDYTGI